MIPLKELQKRYDIPDIELTLKQNGKVVWTCECGIEHVLYDPNNPSKHICCGHCKERLK